MRPEVVLLEKRGDAFEHIPGGFQLGLVVISSQVLASSNFSKLTKPFNGLDRDSQGRGVPE